MSLIDTISPERADGAVATIYHGVQEQFGFVPNGLQLLAASPKLLEDQVGRIAYYHSHPTLGRPLLAAIRYLVADHTGCTYCIDLNAGMLAQMGIAPDVILAARHDPDVLPFDAKDKAMLHLALKVVRAAHEVGGSDIAELRALGWRDQEILEAAHHATFAVSLDLVFNAFQVDAEAL
jgi:alkylhydroperoxidase family enzyme